ncbi:heme oxygenase (staphylobilin-producing) [Fontibacillus solani]|uniref:Heme oxygenase (Staphylobilin-producing) n=1 Tax=Fontibacillus solani TaxID=1572857 RepID=A0A7W3SXQ5_9BACL|nr:antibiotic biosynthesis monooxygenase [Fontibacillus solani]MBA9088181.1 heme oxygenase (staphylobilin-producing) [Fontibacillus solani]
MFVMTRAIVVEKGNSDKVVGRFSADSPMHEMEGLVDVSVLVNRKSKEQEEVVVVIRWESVEAWKNWEKSDAHLEGHRKAKESGQQPPEYIISTTVNLYDAEVVKRGRTYR